VDFCALPLNPEIIGYIICAFMTEQEYDNFLPEQDHGLFAASRDEELNLFSIAISQVASGVTIADARDPELPLIYVNPGFEKMTGYSAAEAIGRSCRFLQGEERDQSGLETLRAALKNGESCVVRLRNFKKDGTLFHNELHISAVRDPAGALTHFVGIQIDVTERVRARESLERSERQTRQALEREEELNEIKSKFISMVSHEFRTPMTGMHSSAALLRRFGEKLGKEKIERHLLNIETSLKRMNRLLDDVLFFSRSEADRIEVVRQPVALENYINGLLENLNSIHPDRAVEVINELEDENEFYLDPDMLDHIFHNLIGNAFKYSPPESLVDLHLSRDGNHLEFRVTDRGIGIPVKDQDHLFEAFHRAENVGTRQGTGLGLNIALRAVELLGGNLSFVSEQGSGSTFIARIPC